MSIISQRIPQLRRRGVTLIELVVVIAVMAVLMGIAIPTLRYAFKDRKLREATRAFTAILERAKARAVELDRPAGIWIERLNDSVAGSRQGVRVFLCESPQPFTGATSSSVAKIHANGIVEFPLDLDRELLLRRVPDRGTFEVLFDHRGPAFVVRRLGAVFALDIIPPVLPEFVTKFVAFKASMPPRKTSSESIDFPGNTVIDLSVSGMGTTGNEFDAGVGSSGVFDTRPMAILFSPGGTVESVIAHGTAVTPHAPVYFLIGRNNGVFFPKRNPGDSSDPGLVDIAMVPSNLMDTSTIWVVVNHRTNMIGAYENVDTSNLLPGRLLSNRLSVAREIARGRIRMGGR